MLLWEFTHPNLGFTTSLPTVVKVDDSYFLALGSGPTQLAGASAQQGKVFILNLRSGALLKVFDADANAFMTDTIAIDEPLNYNIDVIYVGETYTSGTDLGGKMFRITTKQGGTYQGERVD